MIDVGRAKGGEICTCRVTPACVHRGDSSALLAQPLPDTHPKCHCLDQTLFLFRFAVGFVLIALI